MVCCFLVHGPRYETVECTQDMHNEHRNKVLNPQKRKQEQSCDANAHLSIPESFRAVLIRRSLKKQQQEEFPLSEVFETAAVCSWKRTPTADRIAKKLINFPFQSKGDYIFFRITLKFILFGPENGLCIMCEKIK